MQSTIISRFPATVAAVEPELCHDRPTTPDPTPTPAPHPHAAALTPEQRLHREVRHRVCTADERIRAEERAPRTRAEMAPGFDREPLLTLHRPAMVARLEAAGVAR